MFRRLVQWMALGVVTAGSITAGLCLHDTSYASTKTVPYDLHGMNIYLNGQLRSSPKGIYAIDPNTHAYTTYMPIWYIMYALQSLGIQSQWDGTNWNMQLPDNLQSTFNPTTVPSDTETGDVEVWIDHQLVQKDVSIRFADPASNVVTTYVPVWYIGVALHHFGMESSWDGVNWRMVEVPGSQNSGTGWVSIGTITGLLNNVVGGLNGTDPGNTLNNTLGNVTNTVGNGTNSIGNLTNTLSNSTNSTGNLTNTLSNGTNSLGTLTVSNITNP